MKFSNIKQEQLSSGLNLLLLLQYRVAGTRADGNKSRVKVLNNNIISSAFSLYINYHRQELQDHNSEH